MRDASAPVKPGRDAAKLPYVSGSVSRAVSGASRVSRSREEGEDGVGMTRAADLWRADRASKTLLRRTAESKQRRARTRKRVWGRPANFSRELGTVLAPGCLGFRGHFLRRPGQLARPFRLEAFAHPHLRARFPATPPVDDVLIASQIAVARAGSGTPARRSWNPRQHVFARVSSRRDRRGFRGAPASARVRVGASAESDTGGASRKVPTVTEMYVELREMEAQAEANELSCVEAASNNVVASECTVAFVNVAESIDDVKLAARASGVGAPNDAAVAARGGAEGQEDRMAAIAEAEVVEIACVTSGGGVECTAAFNEAYDRAYETTMAKTERYHSLLKRWIRSSGGGSEREGKTRTRV